MKYEITGFEHLHVHGTAASLLDGWQTHEEAAERLIKNGQRFMCFTDHGLMAGIPKQIRSCDEHNLQPLFGCELYVNPLQPDGSLQDHIQDWDDKHKKEARRSYHLLAIAKSQIGYKNLVNLSSWGNLRGFYRKPRVNYEQLIKHKEGIIFTSCCYMSEIGQAFDAAGSEAAEKKLCEYVKMFSPDFYLEIMLLDFKKQRPYNQFILKMKDKYGLPLIVTQDAHYANPEDARMQSLMLMVRTGNTIKSIDELRASDADLDLLELQDKNLWLKSEDELNQKWESDYQDIDYDLFKEAKATTVKICELAKGVKLDRTIKLPEIPDATERLREAIMEGFLRRTLPKNTTYLDRIKEEYSLICEKEFSSYFLIQKMITDEARRVCREVLGGDGSEALGPGRGSAGGSLVCYCLGITDVDPIRHDLLFSRFLSRARGGKMMKLRFTIDPIGSAPVLLDLPPAPEHFKEGNRAFDV